jgi:hypothetical protein
MPKQEEPFFNKPVIKALCYRATKCRSKELTMSDVDLDYGMKN